MSILRHGPATRRSIRLTDRYCPLPQPARELHLRRGARARLLRTNDGPNRIEQRRHRDRPRRLRQAHKRWMMRSVRHQLRFQEGRDDGLRRNARGDDFDPRQQ